MSWRRLLGLLLSGSGSLLLAGCAAEVDGFAGHLQLLSATASKPTNVIERALAYCAAKTESAEVGCVKKSLSDANIDPPRLAALIPGCRPGQSCHYDYTTDDQVGFLRDTAADFVVHWRVNFDLSHAGGKTEDIPITVVEIAS